MNDTETPTWIRHDPAFVADDASRPQEMSAWTGHRSFAYDLLQFGRPNAVVELGTHMGNSLFAFAQAVVDGGLPTVLHAIDTWEGDEHAGIYGPEILAEVKRILGECYESVPVELHQELFDDARAEFADGTVDIVHIDGLHTFDAVKHDYETWLPVLADGGVMLFHDIAGYSDFGSRDFWTEVRETAPHIGFDHSHGLGVLFPKGVGRWAELLDQDRTELIRHYEIRAAAALMDRLRRTTDARSNVDAGWQLEEMAIEWPALLEGTKQALAEADEREKKVRGVLAEHEKVEQALAKLDREHRELQVTAQARFDELEADLRRTQDVLLESDKRENKARETLQVMDLRLAGASAGLGEVTASLGRLEDTLRDFLPPADTRAAHAAAMQADVAHLIQDPDLLRERLALVENAASAAGAAALAAEQRADEAERRAAEAEQLITDVMNTVSMRMLQPARRVYGRGRSLVGR